MVAPWRGCGGRAPAAKILDFEGCSLRFSWCRMTCAGVYSSLGPADIPMQSAIDIKRQPCSTLGTAPGNASRCTATLYIYAALGQASLGQAAWPPPRRPPGHPPGATPLQPPSRRLASTQACASTSPLLPATLRPRWDVGDQKCTFGLESNYSGCENSGS